jgi:molybdate transport system regulatory protein
LVSASPPQSPPAGENFPQLKLRIVFDDARYFGHGKAELLGRIARTGSIAAAGREMGMSYKRAWDLVTAMNAMFATPLVAMARGGAGGGGAQLTDEGTQVLTLYTSVVDGARAAGNDALSQLEKRLRVISGET